MHAQSQITVDDAFGSHCKMDVCELPASVAPDESQSLAAAV